MPTEPFFFLKPTTSYVGNGGIIEVPKGVVAHHEGVCGPCLHVVELAVVLGKTGRDIAAQDADGYIGGYGACVLLTTALAIDMTARNMQDKAKKAGLPWSSAKGLDTFTPIRCVGRLIAVT